MENYTSFDKLVMGISEEERVNLLKKIESNSDSEKENIEIKKKNKDITLDISEKYQKEPFLVRLWLRLKSLFTSSGIDYLYNEYLISSIAKDVEKNYPNIIDYKNGYLITDFYERLKQLKNISLMYVTFDVSKLLTSRVIRLLHPQKVPSGLPLWLIGA